MLIERSNVGGWLIARRTGFPDGDIWLASSPEQSPRSDPEMRMLRRSTFEHQIFA
jgi:hypothetical protein